MRRELPARRRSLRDRPQRLGFLPTMWFWNDHEAQRLLMPLVVVIALPVAAAAQFLTVWLQLWWAWPVLAGLVWPFLLMGLVERHIRRKLARRLPASGRAGELPPGEP